MTNLIDGPKGRVDAFVSRLDEAGVTMEDANLVLQETFLAKVMADELHRVIQRNTFSYERFNVGLVGLQGGGDRRISDLLEKANKGRGRIIGAYKFFRANPDRFPVGWNGTIVFPDSEFIDGRKYRCVRYAFRDDRGQLQWGAAFLADTIWEDRIYAVAPYG